MSAKPPTYAPVPTSYPGPLRIAVLPGLLRPGPGVWQLNHVDPDVDDAYGRLYAEATSGIVDWSAFNAAVEIFVRKRPTDEQMDRFFDNATGIWQDLLAAGRHQAANGFWERILDSVELAEGVGGQVHKGSGYYHWASNSLILGNLDDGMLRLRKAVEEDLRRAGSGLPDTPALRLATLDIASAPHVLGWWAKDLVVSIDVHLTATGSALRFGDIRTRFLLATPPGMIVMFVHAVASLTRFRSRVDTIFGAQLCASHLFRLTVVLEKGLAAKSGLKGKAKLMKGQLDHLSTKTGLKFDRYSGELNEAMHIDADGTLRGLLDGSHHWKDATAPGPDETALAVAYGLRNLAAHNTEIPGVVSERSGDLTRLVLRAFVLCVQHYY